jgi:hypothetical protein
MGDTEYHDEPEIWKPVPGYDYLEASSLGRVRSLARSQLEPNRMRPGTLCTRHYQTRVRSPLARKFGYVVITLREEGRRVPRFVHVLVCLAFHGPKPPGMEVGHRDGVRENNRPSNLRWVTKKENAADRERHGGTPHGEAAHGAKLNWRQVEEIRRLWSAGGMTQARIGLLFGVSSSLVHKITSGASWRRPS